jgi:hypothetical protein
MGFQETRCASYVKGSIGVIAGLVVGLLIPALAPAQGAPVPLAPDAGGARPPVYTQPATAPAESEPVRPLAPSGPPPGPPANAPAAAKTGEPAESTKPTGPQWTSFPELTRGIGDSETLLKE